MNAAIAEQQGYAAALEEGQIGIQGPGKVTARGPDYITFDPDAREIVIWDSKYRGPAGRSVSSTIPASKLKSWMPEVRNAIEAMSEGPAKQQALKAFEDGAVRGRVFKWPQ